MFWASKSRLFQHNNVYLKKYKILEEFLNLKYNIKMNDFYFNNLIV
jgi:hypothetical protein